MEKYPDDSSYSQSTSETIKNNKYILKDSSGTITKAEDDDSDLDTPIVIFPKIFPRLLTFKRAPRVSQV